MTTTISTVTSWLECGSRTTPHQCSERTKYTMEKMLASLCFKMDRCEWRRESEGGRERGREGERERERERERMGEGVRERIKG